MLQDRRFCVNLRSVVQLKGSLASDPVHTTGGLFYDRPLFSEAQLVKVKIECGLGWLGCRDSGASFTSRDKAFSD